MFVALLPLLPLLPTVPRWRQRQERGTEPAHALSPPSTLEEMQ